MPIAVWETGGLAASSASPGVLTGVVVFGACERYQSREAWAADEAR